jgi:hypothetical protein
MPDPAATPNRLIVRLYDAFGYVGLSVIFALCFLVSLFGLILLGTLIAWGIVWALGGPS